MSGEVLKKITDFYVSTETSTHKHTFPPHTFGKTNKFCSFIIDIDLTKRLELNLASPEGCTQKPPVGTKYSQSQRRSYLPQGGPNTSAQSTAGNQSQR